MDHMSQEHLYEHMDFLYYYRTLYSYPGKEKHPFEPGLSDLKKLLKGKNAVIIDMNEAVIPCFYGSFVKDALTLLTRDGV